MALGGRQESGHMTPSNHPGKSQLVPVKPPSIKAALSASKHKLLNSKKLCEGLLRDGN